MLYTVKTNSGSKSIRIAVHQDGSVIVTKPKRVSNLQVKFVVARRAEWIKQKIAEISTRPKRLLAHYSAKDFKENKQQAYVVAHNKILEFNQFYKFAIGKVFIRNQKTRWGSCSGKKNLNFNYKIVFLPEELQDYLVVHELCHLKEMNHSPGFWALVEQQISDYKIRRKELLKY